MATLADLKQKKESENNDKVVVTETKMDNLVPLSKDDLKKLRPNKEEERKDMLSQDLGLLDEMIANEQLAAEEQIAKRNAALKEEEDSAMFDEDDYVQESSSIGNVESKEIVEVKDINLDSDFNDEEDEDDDTADLSNIDELDSFLTDDEDEDIQDDDEDEDKDTEKLISSIKNQLKVTKEPFKPLNLSNFKISSKTKSTADMLKDIPKLNTASWVLMDSGKPFTCSALGAIEIQNIHPEIRNKQYGAIESLKVLYGVLFKHFESPNKPSTIEEWVKAIAYNDLDNIFFGMYKATFGKSNLITYQCNNCKEVKIKNVPLEECIKYYDNNAKDEVERILKYGDSTFENKIISNLIQLSDTLAVSVKSPSIYNIIFELSTIDEKFLNKYASVLSVTTFIENIYEIDSVNSSLIPITIKEDPKNITKSVKRRIRAKVELLKNLTSEQYDILLAEINSIDKHASSIQYIQPEHKCEKCGNVIAEVQTTAESMLFTRHQLALMKNSSVE